MKESSLYLYFFKKNLLIFILPLILFTTLALYFVFQQPVLYKGGRLFEILYTEESVSQKVILTDQVVSNLRTEITKEKLGIKDEVSVYKSAPLSLKIETTSSSKEQIGKTLDIYTRELGQNIDAVVLGDDEILPSSNNNYLIILGAVVFSLFTSLFISLIREYFTF